MRDTAGSGQPQRRANDAVSRREALRATVRAIQHLAASHDYSAPRMAELARAGGLNWFALDADQRQALIDAILAER